MAPIVVGNDPEWVVDVTKCKLHDHKCVHDWRVVWDNVERTGQRPEEQ